MSSARIKAIDSASVHRIHSGQVVLDLQGAIKELVENSIDAGATSVDVRIKDNGLETIEVVDNGSGIDEENWSSIGLKHYTSKLPSLEELALVSTFGFRGEALSALCALCESVTVTTATKETAPMGAVITLGRDGRVLDDTGRVARQRGTTITLSGLFKPLPVRRKEFERTAKREFTKALSILNAYALVPASAAPAEGKPGVRLKVESIGAGRGGKRSTVLATDGRGALRSSVSAVWGPKALEGVVDIDLEFDVDVDKAMARREGITETSQTVRVRGLISSGAWGQGRSSTDRQFTYINGRPCTLSKILKAVNELYKSFNTNQSPLAILDFQIPKESVDINVSPDKRTIFVHSEANLIEALRSALEDFFQPTRSTYAVAGASTTVKLVQAQATADDREAESETEADDITPAVTEEPEVGSEGETERSQSPAPSRVPQRTQPSWKASAASSAPRRVVTQQTLDTTIATWSASATQQSRPKVELRAPAVTTAPSTGRQARAELRHRLTSFASQQVDLTAETDDSGDDSEEEPREAEGPEAGEAEEDELDDNDVQMLEDEKPPVPDDTRPADEPNDGAVEAQVQVVPSSLDEPEPEESLQAPVSNGKHRADDLTLEAEATLEESLSPIPNDVNEMNDMDVDDAEEQPEAAGYRDEISFSGITGAATLHFDMARLQKRMAVRRARRAGQSSGASTCSRRTAASALAQGQVTKAAGVQNRDAEEAEAALARVIRKDDFAHMQVLGQFNKGFIIARLQHAADPASGAPASDDLFIVDQHASDEKYNFETLQRTTVIKGQALIRPRPLQLTVADELVAMENMDVLRANGFDVAVDEDAAPGRGERIALKAMPVSKETTFDFTDLEQLLHMLSDSARPSGQMVRCTKARSMFAMRACRRSVMIGKSLTKAQMVALLRNMGTIDQPWNCPHGRPTMRHLCSLSTSHRSRSGADRIDWSSKV